MKYALLCMVMLSYFIPVSHIQGADKPQSDPQADSWRSACIQAFSKQRFGMVSIKAPDLAAFRQAWRAGVVASWWAKDAEAAKDAGYMAREVMQEIEAQELWKHRADITALQGVYAWQDKAMDGKWLVPNAWYQFTLRDASKAQALVEEIKEDWEMGAGIDIDNVRRPASLWKQHDTKDGSVHWQRVANPDIRDMRHPAVSGSLKRKDASLTIALGDGKAEDLSSVTGAHLRVQWTPPSLAARPDRSDLAQALKAMPGLMAAADYTMRMDSKTGARETLVSKAPLAGSAPVDPVVARLLPQQSVAMASLGFDGLALYKDFIAVFAEMEGLEHIDDELRTADGEVMTMAQLYAALPKQIGLAFHPGDDRLGPHMTVVCKRDKNTDALLKWFMLQAWDLTLPETAGETVHKLDLSENRDVQELSEFMGMHAPALFVVKRADYWVFSTDKAHVQSVSKAKSKLAPGAFLQALEKEALAQSHGFLGVDLAALHKMKGWLFYLAKIYEEEGAEVLADVLRDTKSVVDTLGSLRVHLGSADGHFVIDSRAAGLLSGLWFYAADL